jgi:PPOX class probable F420-dependent enzyme
VDIADALAVVRDQHHAVLATSRGDGTPQMSPVAVAVDQTDHLLVSSRITAYKTRNLRRDPRAWLCVLPDGFFGRWIQVGGSVRIVELPAAMDGLVDYYRSISGEHPDWEEYRAAMQRDERVLLQITLTSAGPDREG